MALGVLAQSIGRQAATMSYNDSFIMILAIFALTTPAILVLRKAKPQAVAVDAH